MHGQKECKTLHIFFLQSPDSATFAEAKAPIRGNV
nr:MAG TPA: hypothetical protein [Caudoviricetes sp.]